MCLPFLFLHIRPDQACWLQSSWVLRSGCLVLSRKRICFDFFFYAPLKRWSGVSRNRSLSHLSSVWGWLWVSECHIVFKGLYLSFGTDRGVIECQESDNCGIVCCGCHHMKCCWFWRLELTFLLHKLLFVSQTSLMLPLQWTSDVAFM